MKGNWRKTLAVAAVTVGAAASMGAVYATVGTEGDPLITLSYLNDKFTPEVLSQVDIKAADQREALKAQLDQQVQAFTADIQSRLDEASGSGGGAPAQAASVYTVVPVPAGQTLVGDIGCEVMLRVGSAACVSDSEPGLIDMTDGATLSSGNELVKNHLYMMTIEGRGVKAVTDIKLLVRGTYTIQ